MRSRGAVRRAGILGAVTLGAGLTGCSGSSVDTRAEQTAQEQVIGLLNTVAMNSRRDEIEDFARAAEGRATTVVAVEPAEAEEYTDVFGWLTFRVLLDDPRYTETGGFLPAPEWDPGPYCFRVAFDSYGKHGEFGTADGVRLVECPAGSAPVDLLADEVTAVAANAREAAHEVLDGLPATGLPAEDDIAAHVGALLDPPDAENVTLAAPSAAVDGSDVGIAMGGPDDCVLVARVDGEVIDVYAPRVYLQPGELGCGPWTALAEDLRPPH